MPAATVDPTAFAGRRILLVEEDRLVRALLVDMLETIGYAIAHETGTIPEALQLAMAEDFDLAVLDVLINDDYVFPVADALDARGVPFVFATGLPREQLPEPYRHRPMLQKPIGLDDLERMLAQLAGL